MATAAQRAAEAQRQREREQAQRERERQQAQAQSEREAAQAAAARERQAAETARAKAAAQQRIDAAAAATAAAQAAPAAAAAPLRIMGQDVGAVLSRKEAEAIAKDRNKTVAQVFSKALDGGAAIGAGAVNAFNSGKLGPNGSNLISFGGIAAAPGQNKGTTAALQQLQALQGLQMNKGTAYAGYSTTETPAYNRSTVNGGNTYIPGSTTYNPIVLPRSVVTGVQRVGAKPAAAAPAAAAPATGPVADWENSVNASNQAIIDSINAQIEANAAQANLYMGQIDQLMQAMQQQSQAPGGLNSIVPYAVTSSSVAPAAGAQTTQAITARKKPSETDLSINPLVASLDGTGLNIGI